MQHKHISVCMNLCGRDKPSKRFIREKCTWERQVQVIRMLGNQERGLLSLPDPVDLCLNLGKKHWSHTVISCCSREVSEHPSSDAGRSDCAWRQERSLTQLCQCRHHKEDKCLWFAGVLLKLELAGSNFLAQLSICHPGCLDQGAVVSYRCNEGFLNSKSKQEHCLVSDGVK